VSEDDAKAEQYNELAAMTGNIYARTHLGIDEFNAGNFDQAIKHWLIAVSLGDIRALNDIKKAVIEGHATKGQYAQALRQYQEYLD
jgi:TPR repeat protein